MNHPDLKLTDYEVEALAGAFNLADGHARYAFADSHAQIIEILSRSLLPELQQLKVENEFGNTFFGLANQKASVNLHRVLYCPSASLSIEIAANHLRDQHLSVGMIEPVFDNLPDILKRHHIPMTALREADIYSFGIKQWLEGITTNAMFLVMPNNPTGYVFSEADFQRVVEFCKQSDKLLILDFSFRFFSPEMLHWSQYDLLEQSGVRYIAIEDTGKTWPTFELKASTLLSDKSTFPFLQHIYRDLFICLSPVVLLIVAEFVRASQRRGLQNIWKIVADNRQELRQVVSNTMLKPTSLPNGSVEWLQIQNDTSDTHLVAALMEYGIHILPGRNFFWSQPRNHSSFIRIALMRDINYFRNAMNHLKEILPLVFG